MAYELPIDPSWLSLSDGFLSTAFSTTDEYFPDETDTPEALYLDWLVANLPSDEAACVELRVFAGMSYRDVAGELDLTTGDPPRKDPKKAWRLCQRGLGRLREKLIVRDQIQED